MVETSESLLETLIAPGRTVLCDGAMGTMLYARGVFINRCYDELNLSQPDLIRSIHEEYLHAGAEMIETNTFGANAIRLARYGLADKVSAINHAGVALARKAAQHSEEKTGAHAYVAGAIGPLGARLAPAGTITVQQAHDAFAEQIAALAAAGADLLIAETFPSVAEAEIVVRAARDIAPHLPLFVMVTVDDNGNTLDGTTAEETATRLTIAGANAVGCNCSSGPHAVLDVIERMRAVTHLPLAAMPNAGLPRAVDGRNIYLTSPEYMASFARKFAKAGATFIGGCCGTTPNHIKAMRSALRAIDAQVTAKAEVTDETQAAVQPPPFGERSKLAGLLANRQFVSMVEIVPPLGVNCQKELDGAKKLADLGVHVINVPDSPRASARMSAQSLCVQIQHTIGIETLIHVTCRDRNLLAIQSDMLGASSIGLKNVLCLTGDPPKLGNYPDATAVFDVDAIGLVNILRNLNHGLDLGKNPIGQSAAFAIGVAANPGVPDVDNEVRRFALKVEAGAEYAITQPVFDMRLLETFLRRVEEFRIPVIAGIWPLTSLRNAEFMKNDLRVAVPDEIMFRMHKAGEVSADHARAEGIKIAQEMLAHTRPQVEGVQVSAPFGKYTAAAQVLELLG
ncbi:MAG: bifunctional homocysteine S-methyltransferase/methylenetetrahydrofolate reductase [Acidobacteriaceae bacterium]|nr:bifunctional homocysteine S-methyltransferase/methylenetetrahydrofolate reductase [Acidobacteriaceae bacterium]